MTPDGIPRRQGNRRTRFGFAGPLAACLALTLLDAPASPTATASRNTPPQIRRTAAQVRDADIAFFEARIRRDSLGAIDLARVSGLYLQRARETGSGQDLLRAEAAARRSLNHRRSRNPPAAQMLALSLLPQHRFAEALDVAAELVEHDPATPAFRALLAEIQMELGRYDEARTNFGMLRSHADNPTIAAQLARWDELTGDVEGARALLLSARAAVLARARVPPEQVAWFHLRVGDLALRYGHFDEAAHAFDAGLAAHPEDYRVLAAAARLAVAEGDWRGAIRFAERSLATTIDPATLGLLADGWRALGESARAENADRVLAATMRLQAGSFHRAWGLYLLDHDRQVAEVLARAEADLVTRRDVYGYDLLAWALHKSGRDPEACRAMRQALRLGTPDPMLLRHASTIEM